MSDETRKMKDKQAKLIAQLAEVCEALNWLIVIPQEDTTTGLIIGNKEYVDKAARRVYGHRYEIVNPKTDHKKPSPVATKEELESQIVELSDDEYQEFMETGELPESVKLPDKPTYH